VDQGEVMSEFCVKCCEKESQIEILNSRFYKESQCMRERIAKLQRENEALINENERLAIDVAFYKGDLPSNIN